jgi:hypothetical protein
MVKVAVLKQIMNEEKFEEKIAAWLSQHPKVKILNTAMGNAHLVIFYDE